MNTLVIGGIKSGKSSMASTLALNSAKSVTVVATATALDSEMTARIQKHRETRPLDWQTIEEPICLGEVLREVSESSSCVIIDCLTLWITNLLLLEDELTFQTEKASFLGAVDSFKGDLVLVANETSMGIIPTGSLTRRYCDEAGLLHQTLAASCAEVVLMIAGLPLYLKKL